MPHPVLVTEWPTGDSLRLWLTQNAVGVQADLELVDEIVGDASASVFEDIDPAKLPDDPDLCPRTVARAIVLEAARLLYRRQSPHGMAAFGDVALRLRSVDIDVEKLIHAYTFDASP